MPVSLHRFIRPAGSRALAREGRETRYRELIRRYERPVFSLIYRMVRDRETRRGPGAGHFIKVLNHIDRYRPEFKFSSWLFKIANNVAIDHLRRRQLDTISIDGSPHAETADAIEATRSQSATAQRIAARRDGSAGARAADRGGIAKLRPEYRACIMLRHVEDDSYEEIAEILDLPLGTVKTYIHRARQELREHLGDLK